MLAMLLIQGAVLRNPHFVNALVASPEPGIDTLYDLFQYVLWPPRQLPTCTTVARVGTALGPFVSMGRPHFPVIVGVSWCRVVGD